MAFAANRHHSGCEFRRHSGCWRTIRARSLWPLLPLLLASAPAAAEDTTVPSLQLLEFLADWQDDDGQWLDPMDLAPADPPPADDEQSKGENDD